MDELEQVRHALEAYDAPLLRQVAESLCKPRNQWPADELISRCLSTLNNAATLDRRLKDLDLSSRRLLGVIAHSGQPRWEVGSLVELSTALGHESGAEPILSLLNTGLLYPAGLVNGAAKKSRLKKLDETWINQPISPSVYIPPLVSSRAASLQMDLPECPGSVQLSLPPAVREADGLEWPLRLAALWQQVRDNPLRRTQQGDFFKRDLDRLRGDALLASPPSDALADVPDPALLAVAWGLAAGVLEDRDGELHVGESPIVAEGDLSLTIATLWAALSKVKHWDPADGWGVTDLPGNPYPSAYLLCLLVLGKLPTDGWVDAEAVGRWVAERHPFWARERNVLSIHGKSGTNDAEHIGLVRFLLGVAYPLRLIQATKHEGERWLIRLSSLGRLLLALADSAPRVAPFPQTLVVQPNLEVLVYRQGLTPELIGRLTGIAKWKTLGAACTAQLEPDTVYHALQAGETFDSIVELLNRHGTKTMPTSVVESLRTWANKRERISLYPSAALFEFTSADQLNDALSRGLPAVRLSDRLAIVTNEANIDYRHFRLIATRDYTLPPEKCVDIEADGVTLSVDVGKSDLLLETEVQRFAETLPQASANGRRLFRLTPASLSAAQKNGLDMSNLETWFTQRSQQPMSPAARLLLNSTTLGPLSLQRHLVLHVGDATIADGLQQWPGTRSLIEGRLGPTALLIAEEHVEVLKERLTALGIGIQ